MTTNKTPVTKVAHKLLSYMIISNKSGQARFYQSSLKAVLNMNIPYATRMLIDKKIITKRIIDNRACFYLNGDFDINDFYIEDNSKKGNYRPKKKESIIIRDCPYKGRRYEDIANPDYDRAGFQPCRVNSRRLSW